MADRKNPDYSASALNLNGGEATLNAYHSYQDAVMGLALAEKEIEDKIPTELIQARNEARILLDNMESALKEAVKNYGGFQNVEEGQYALIQISKTPVYHAEPVRKAGFTNEVTNLMLVESVNVEGIKYLLNSKKVTEEELKEKGIITYKEIQKTIIR